MKKSYIVPVIPAYGRSYQSAKSALADWDEGKDFRILFATSYLSIRDSNQLKSDGVTNVHIYWNKDDDSKVEIVL